ncbi:PREDICTED: protein artemis [Ceratosolen solmsi marchali]|uniref:Protein artemis n=1 Tax=Ceratosolen solmsi marchali TaxID=326594 RepID=A0AAJ7E0P2_9HYME|nr:PREDICTED: protein artemis [Ceratosolen solmsi marchali]
MSTFLGFIDEIPGISIDCFDEENLNSSVFFLSHCHYDHMKGLDYKFFNYLMKTNKFLYCSHISRLILKHTFNLSSDLNKYVKILSLNDSIIINYKYDNIHHSLKVSSISSGHCPGSIMFLYNLKDKRILYTGDFRINIEDFSNLKSLHYIYNTEFIPLNIDTIYIDTTFFNVDYNFFPSRFSSMKELYITVKDWIEKDPKNVVLLEISALYGSEFIYIELSKILHKKIHVQDQAYKIYKQMEILTNCVTDVSESTPIHACINKNSWKNTLKLKCRSNINQKHILTIVLSAKKWIDKNTSCIIEWDNIRKQTKNLCYSTHASYSELKAFLVYFKPQQVIACVCDKNDRKKIYDLLSSIIQIIKSGEVYNNRMKLDVLKYKLCTYDLKPAIITD